MTETDIFHLGDGYYVYVNYEAWAYVDGVYSLAYVGTSKAPLVIENHPLIAYSFAVFSKKEEVNRYIKKVLLEAKEELGIFLLEYKEQLKEIIHEKEYWKHN